ncbi:MAG: hypothetical protein WBQ31_04770, partial [Candidatus Acidiferrales bacterium]
METVLNDILGIFPVAGHTLCNAQKSALVTLDQDFKSTDVSTLGGSNKDYVFRFQRNHHRRNYRFTVIR